MIFYISSLIESIASGKGMYVCVCMYVYAYVYFKPMFIMPVSNVIHLSE